MVTAVQDDPLAKITPRHLRQADEMCRRRLSLELTDQRGNAPGSARFEVSNRLGADARLAHTEMAVPDPSAFVPPAELLPEQQRAYAAGVAGYLALFGDEVARTIDLGFDTVLDDLDVRLVGDVGLALETETGCELRVLRLGERGFGQALLDDVDLRFATLRAVKWTGDDGHLRVVVADVLNVDRAEFTIDLAERLHDTRAWVAERVTRIRTLADDPQPRAGRDCLGCRFVAGCRAHR
jgi:hypothetical protein